MNAYATANVQRQLMYTGASYTATTSRNGKNKEKQMLWENFRKAEKEVQSYSRSILDNSRSMANQTSPHLLCLTDTLWGIVPTGGK